MFAAASDCGAFGDPCLRGLREEVPADDEGGDDRQHDERRADRLRNARALERAHEGAEEKVEQQAESDGKKERAREVQRVEGGDDDEQRCGQRAHGRLRLHRALEMLECWAAGSRRAERAEGQPARRTPTGGRAWNRDPALRLASERSFSKAMHDPSQRARVVARRVSPAHAILCFHDHRFQIQRHRTGRGTQALGGAEPRPRVGCGAGQARRRARRAVAHRVRRDGGAFSQGRSPGRRGEQARAAAQRKPDVRHRQARRARLDQAEALR